MSYDGILGFVDALHGKVMAPVPFLLVLSSVGAKLRQYIVVYIGPGPISWV